KRATQSSVRQLFRKTCVFFPEQKRGHVAVATFKKNVCVNVHWRVCLGNRWTKWSVQLKRLGGSFACTLLIDYCNFLTFHGTIQTHIYHTPQTKETGARHKIADATVLCHPATRSEEHTSELQSLAY